MRYKLFQALQMEGASGMNADRREAAKRLVGPDGDDCERAATAVAHYCPWVRRERNRLAQGAGFLLPSPGDRFERRPDKGERFYGEYAIEQAARRAPNGGVCFAPCQILEAGGCPCQACCEARARGGGGGGAAQLSPFDSNFDKVLAAHDFVGGDLDEFDAAARAGGSIGSSISSRSSRRSSRSSNSSSSSGGLLPPSGRRCLWRCLPHRAAASGDASAAAAAASGNAPAPAPAAASGDVSPAAAAALGDAAAATSPSGVATGIPTGSQFSFSVFLSVSVSPSSFTAAFSISIFPS
jgi:hypothetical protein